MKFSRIIVAALLLMSLLIPCSAITIEPPAEPEGFQWDKSKETLLAGLWEADIASIHEAYRMGWITCTDLTAYYLERIEAYNDTYNCFITMCDDAMEQAARCDEALASGEAQGTLFGIPIVIKDNMRYKGYYTTNGRRFVESEIATYTADVVDYILQEGAIIIGKTNMSTNAEDSRASYSEAVGETKNAYNSELASGGSSGGSAVATSLNFALAGLGTDTNSSLRLPAVLNGCYSLRVTTGNLSMTGIRRLSTKRDVPGVITRTVMDQAVILDVLSGDTTSYAENLNDNAISGLRFGILDEYTYPRGEKNIDAEVIAAFENAVAELESLGAEVIRVKIPEAMRIANNFLINNNVSDQVMLYQLMKDAMEKNQVDALIFPTYLSAPHRSGVDSNGKYWHPSTQPFLNNCRLLSSCAGVPEMAIPIGYHSRGAGIGMEIAALKNEEQLLLDIAYTYELNYDHRLPTDNAPDLYASSYEGTLSQCIDAYYDAIYQYEEAQRLAAEEAARLEEERLQQEEAARIEEERKRQEQEALEEALREQEAEQRRETLAKKQRTAQLIMLVLIAVVIVAATTLILVVCRKRPPKVK